MKFIALVFGILGFSAGYAQEPNLHTPVDMVDQVSNIENLIRALSYQTSMETKTEEVEGTAYLNEDFVSGNVLLTTGVNYAKIPLRYNIYNDQIEFKSQSGKIYNINNPSGINEINIGTSRFIYAECRLKNKQVKLFTEVLTSGKISLLKHYRMKVQPAKPAETHRDAQPSKLVKIPSEYFIQGKSGVARLFRNEKELLNLLPEKNTELKGMISREKLLANNEDDLITIVEYYNSH